MTGGAFTERVARCPSCRRDVPVDDDGRFYNHNIGTPGHPTCLYSERKARR
jgi:hypothetical protein